jgi:hypothetical protein
LPFILLNDIALEHLLAYLGSRKGQRRVNKLTAMSLLERWGLRHVESVDDYLSVLIPLDKAHLYSHSAKQGRAGSASRREDAEVGDADEEKDGENETSGMLHGHAGEYSIEGLRKEMRQGNQGKWTSNESMLFQPLPGDQTENRY